MNSWYYGDHCNKVHITNVHYNIPYQWVPFHSTFAWYSQRSPLDWNLVRSLSIQFQFRRFHSWEPEAQRDSTTRARSWGCLRRGMWVECRQWAGTGVEWEGLATWRCTYAWRWGGANVTKPNYILYSGLFSGVKLFVVHAVSSCLIFSWLLLAL